MTTFVFDLDDTLYDQLEPFSLSVEKNLPTHTGIPIVELYKKHRYYSDIVFEKSSSGEMKMRDMHVFRIKEALKEFNIDISDNEALKFQLDYESYQNQIIITPDIENALNYCKDKNIFMGIITNGPSNHQRNKIRQLNLTKWIPMNRIMISGDYDFAKPDKRIFLSFQEKHGLNPDKTYYIGDSFHSDVVGALESGWKSIWLNHRDREPINNISPDYTLGNEDSLLELLIELS